MNAPHVPSLIIAGAAVGLTMYNRNVWQNMWNALKGPAKPLAAIAAVPAGSTVSPGNPQPPQGSTISPAIPTANDPLAFAESQVQATRSPSDWLDFCLQYYDDVMKKLGRQTFYGVQNAQDVCNTVSLNSGPAPRGAGVCFNYNHIGVSNGGCTYTSAGFPGGVQVRDYCADRGYVGWFNQ